ncbi:MULTISPECIES: DNA sulfur modification protein DndB [Rhizobium]|uniref:DNA sulfur modification protein DndB n=1 Tax=Rhizobium TaxID=379 RepID=UPI0024764893|nr:DNA sulfur modification protein DndB [Rhizobium leguminosarum]
MVLFVDRGLRRAQQMFADLNIHAVRPNSSIKLLYDHRDDLAGLTREVVMRLAHRHCHSCNRRRSRPPAIPSYSCHSGTRR